VQQEQVNEIPLEQLVAMVLRHHKTPAALASAIVQSLSDIQRGPFLK
jgi:hypothetical protein